ncbi:MAG: dipeptidase [Cellulosilyticaceae bacterium]
MPIIDCHCDTIDRMYHEKTHLKSNDYHIDLQKLRQSEYLAQWFAFFIDSHQIQEITLMEKFKKMHAYLLNELEINKEDIALATDYASYIHNKKNGKISAFLSTEEGQVIDGNIDNIDILYTMGIRMMTLTWNYPNAIGYPHDMKQGLTTFGKEVIEHLQTKKMLLDISHFSEVGVWELTNFYKKPIIASHCNARVVKNHTRNLSDQMIRYIASKGGIIGVNFYSPFLGNTEISQIDDMKKHIQYLYNLAGEDCIAFGTDFDGINCDLEVCNAGEMDRLIDSLRNIYPEKFIEKLCYQNMERIIKENL